MNQLVIIGNGFDLAHELKTSYKDFLSWYLKEMISECRTISYYNDDIFRLKAVLLMPIDKKDIDVDFKTPIPDLFKKYNIRMNPPASQILFEIITDVYADKWGDIEYSFYKKLVNLYNNSFVKSEDISPIKNYNLVFDFFKNKLAQYLETATQKEPEINLKIKSHIQKILSPLKKNNVNNQRAYFLNFNYTSTIENYLKEYHRNPFIEVCNIHGNIKDKNLIFGYGDMMDVNFRQLEDSNKSEFLAHIKQYFYLKSHKYNNLEIFLNARIPTYNVLQKYDVHIMGHSCGISDRVLLNKIFNPETCNSIKIYYYKIDETNDDFFEKTQNILRNFSIENKPKFSLIQNKENSLPLS